MVIFFFLKMGREQESILLYIWLYIKHEKNHKDLLNYPCNELAAKIMNCRHFRPSVWWLVHHIWNQIFCLFIDD